MSDKTYKLIELVGVSENSIEEAIQNAVARANQTWQAEYRFARPVLLPAGARANQTLKNLDWFEVVEARGMIQDGTVNQFQVKIKVGFRLNI